MGKPKGRPTDRTASRKYSGCQTTVTAASVARAGVNTAALRRLVELHYRGWLTPAELEAEFGAPYDRLAAIAAMPYWRLS